MGILNDLKNRFIGGSAPSIEFAEADAELFKDYILDCYAEAVEYVKPLAIEWQQNRRAYLGKTHDHFAGLASEGITGESDAIYCSAIVQDKISDLVAIQLQSRPRVYPLPKVKENFNLPPTVLQGLPTTAYIKKVWEKCFEDFEERKSIKKKYIQLAIDARLCNIAVAKVLIKYDWEAKQYDADLQVVQPEDFLIDPGATDLDNARYCFHRTYYSAYELCKMYPDKKDEILAAVKKDTEQGITEIRRGSGEKDSTRTKNKVEILEGYFRSDETESITRKISDYDPNTGEIIETTLKEDTLKYPTGRRITMLPQSKMLLKDEVNPYPGFPFAVFNPSPTSWSFYGRNEATPLRNLQHLDDRTFQQGESNMKMVCNSKLFYERDAIDDPDSLSNEIGEMVPIKRVGSVYYSKGTNILNDTANLHNMIEQRADSISGVHAPAAGQPLSLTSGRAIGLLQQASNRKQIGSTDMFSEFLQKIWKQIADLMLDTYRAGRMLRVSDDDIIPTQLLFDLMECTESIDVKVGSDSAFPVDPVSKFNMFTTLAGIRDQNGIPVVDDKYILEQLSFPGISELLKRKQDYITNQTIQGAAGFNASVGANQQQAQAQAGIRQV